MNNNLYLFFNDTKEKNEFLKCLNQIDGIQAECVFKHTNKIFSILRKIHLLSNLPGIGIWLLDWKNDLDKYDGVLCIASEYAPNILTWIRRKVNVKLINYYWDKIGVSGYPVVRNELFNNWSFCKDDCEQYEMSYNPQFFIGNMKLSKMEKKYDVSFVGADREGKWKERTEFVIDFYNILQKEKLRSYFYYVTHSKDVPNDIRKDKRMSEEEYYKIVSQSRAVLEIIQPGNEWITLRPLLALSNHIKLITNNTKIVSERYYSKENIFILGVDDENDINSFVHSKFNPIPKDILAYYEAKEWGKRFWED